MVTSDENFLKKIPKFDKDTIVLSTNNIDSRDFRTVSLNEKNMIVNKFFDKTNEKLENVFARRHVVESSLNHFNFHGLQSTLPQI